MYAGTVDVALDANFLYVTYNITAPNVYLLETHLDVFDNITAFRNAKKLSGGGAIPGKFAYKASFSAGARKTSYTATIPRSVVDGLPRDCFFIASHAALSNGETAWGGLCSESGNGVSLNNAAQFPGANWSTYFEFCKSGCNGPVDFTYAWEDLRNTGNDADYNDLVIKSDVTKTSNMMQIKFTAAARGAGYDHAFKFNIPKTGIPQGSAGIFGASSVQDMGTYFTVTVFPSTKTALPSAGSSGFANTVPSEPCVAPNEHTVTIAIDGSFPYNAARPYEPFISVYTSGMASGTPAYDLNVYGVSTPADTWTDTDGDVYPNGILIPSDWKWPLENVRITAAYPNFRSITDGFNPNWANTAPTTGTFSSCN
ncbi:LruC domain-containing protein [Hymenobacter sp. BT186]|uniref:LruC domain-containing protein n=1 Tax=Hymenobacter telluris TaxID=2816474 RepID=A0A939EX36_9BACT|nr:LruC domain-containing protein [Hymenobacter telluris]MBO0358192.1 LruC domain-containing protein [Hymenobacter telluris]